MEQTMNMETEVSGKQKTVIYENGRIYYTKESERKIYFFLTLVMLALGILYKTGIIG